MKHNTNALDTPVCTDVLATTEGSNPSEATRCNTPSRTDAPTVPSTTAAAVVPAAPSSSSDQSERSSHTTDPPAADTPAVAGSNTTDSKDDDEAANITVADGESNLTAANNDGPAHTPSPTGTDSVTPQPPAPAEESLPEPVSTDNFPVIDFDNDNEVDDPKEIWWTAEIWEQSRTVSAVFKYPKF